MLAASYRKRLDADLIRWVDRGLVTAESASAIRRDAESAGGFKLPSLLGMLGGLLIAASVAAFVAANWDAIPRVAKLVMILAAVVGAFLLAARLEKRGSPPLSVDAASTCGVLFFGGGLALIGQMYHLPADWPSGALLVCTGALAAAFLMRSTGALIVALVALAAWVGGIWSENHGQTSLLFLAFYLPAFWLALSRSNGVAHALSVLVLGIWLGLLPGDWFGERADYGLIAYALALSVLFVLVGAIALDRGGPALFAAFMPWGLLALLACLGVELARILDLHEARGGLATKPIYLAYAAALAGLAILVARARDRRFASSLAIALLFALLVPMLFWSGGAVTMIGRIIVASLVLSASVALIIAGAAGGVRKLMAVGSALFGLAILILLWQTIGTLLDQSLFFLVAGATLLGLAGGARRLLAAFGKKERMA